MNFGNENTLNNVNVGIDIRYIIHISYYTVETIKILSKLTSLLLYILTQIYDIHFIYVKEKNRERNNEKTRNRENRAEVRSQAFTLFVQLKILLTHSYQKRKKCIIYIIEIQI